MTALEEAVGRLDAFIAGETHYAAIPRDDEDLALVLSAVRGVMPKDGEAIVKVSGGEDYAGVHPELIAQDAMARTLFEWELLDLPKPGDAG